jgi:putative endonuclease
MPKPSFTYYVYILSNADKTIYTGVTGDLFRRLWQHRTHAGSKFVKKHDLSRLVWFDETDDVTVAIAREKQIKNWRREWKLSLVEAGNPEWLDLADGWYGVGRDSESSSE